MSAEIKAGSVTSHTVIRVPGKANAAAAPFVLLLVACDDGRRCLGHFAGGTPPPIGARVRAEANSATPMFKLEESS